MLILMEYLYLVSGVGQYRGADLLLFDDMQAMENQPGRNILPMSVPVPDSTSENGPMAMEVERSDAYGPTVAQGILIPGK